MTIDRDHGSRLDPLLREALDWVARMASGAVTDGERNALADWRARSPAHDLAFRRADALGDQLRLIGRSVLAQETAPTVVMSLRRPTTRRMLLGGAIAASAAAVAIGLKPDLVNGRLGDDADFATATGERRTLRLANGLNVALDAQTRIAVKSSASAHRIDLLHGRAEITSNLDRVPVILTAGVGRTTAARSRFGARYDDDQACITCLDGQIRIDHPRGNVMLAAREEVVYGPDAIGAARAVDALAATAWKSGKLVFRRTPLTEVIREVNRYRPGEVILVNRPIGSRPINGVFDVGHMESVIVQIEQVTGASATHLPGGVVLLT